VVIAQAFAATALYVTAARQGFDGVDDQLIATSRTLGQSPWATFRRVSVPLAAPGLLTGAALGWAQALGEFGEFGATLVFAGNLPGTTQTMPLAIYTAMESDVATAVAISLLLLVALVPLVLVQYVAQRLGREQSDRDQATGGGS
jgi:molybdate transport system permease protein